MEGKCTKTYQGHTNTKYSLKGAFGSYGAEDQAFVVSGSEDGKIVIWDVVSKEILQTLEGHDGAVLTVDTLPDQNLLVSGGIDRSVVVWEAVDTDASNDRMNETS